MCCNLPHPQVGVFTPLVAVDSMIFPAQDLRVSPLPLWFLPRWEIGRWSPCSLTCGVGLQTRDVFCSHLLSRETNETVILADELCHQPKPSAVQACNRFNCPPAWYPAQWQPVSLQVTPYWGLCLQLWFRTGDILSAWFCHINGMSKACPSLSSQHSLQPYSNPDVFIINTVLFSTSNELQKQSVNLSIFMTQFSPN